MGKKIQISVPTPCHESWENMLPADKGKFCQSCSKEVIDFTTMSNSQVVAFFKKPSNRSVCGRFMNDQLGKDIREHRKRLPWIKYFFQFALPAFLISTRAYTQGEVKGKVASVCAPKIRGDTVVSLIDEIVSAPRKISGQIKTKDGTPVYYASVTVKGTNTGTTCDTAGKFSLKIDSWKKSVTLIVSSVGFEMVERKIDLQNYDDNCIIRMEMAESVMGDIEVIAGMVSASRQKTFPLIRLFSKDSVFSKFDVCPNPAIAGSIVMIDNKKLKPGNYILELYNETGQVIAKEKIQFSANQGSIPVKLPQTTAGIYFLKLASEKKNVTHTQKIIIR